MARGKKTSTETVTMVLSLYAFYGSYQEVAKEMDMAVSTVRKIVKDHENTEEFAKLCAEKKELFSQKATEIINASLKRLLRDVEDPETKIPTRDLSVIIGTLYDKRALAEGTATENVKISADDAELDKCAQLAGYRITKLAGDKTA